MKKIVCLMLALLMLASVAVAESPSKTVADLNKFTVSSEGQGSENAMLGIVDTTETNETLPEYEEVVAACEKEIEKLAEGGNVAEYFGEVTDAEGNAVDLKEKLGVATDDLLNVFEFCPMVASGFEEGCGAVTVNMQFATAYEEGQKVLVLIGLISEENGAESIAWKAFDGESVHGGIQVEPPEEIIMQIQNGKALMAVVSK